MADGYGQDRVEESKIDGIDRLDQAESEEVVDSSSIVGSSVVSVVSMVGSAVDSSANCHGDGSGTRNGLANRLTEILVDDGDGDLLLQQDERESNFLEWLQALDMQVMGACRADERLKPLLKVNVSAGAAEDLLLSHLSQHFAASEVGLLARCLCIPLVSFRVGKVIKQGNQLCPTSVRGSLNLALLPSSGLRISFVGDDGHIERLATLSSTSECSAVAVEEISADPSGRSFLIKVPSGGVFYFWCAEKSKLLGIELLSKMKDLLKSKPTLAELTGISESRLESFATHLRAYLVGSTGAATTTRLSIEDLAVNNQSSSMSAKAFRSRPTGAQSLKTHPHGSLSPRSSSFKDGLPRMLSALKNASRDKSKRWAGELHLPSPFSSTTSIRIDPASDPSKKGKFPEESGIITSSATGLSFLESLGNSALSTVPSAMPQFPPISSLLSPYYCWCPPASSQSPIAAPKFPLSSTEPLSLPPLSSLLPASLPTGLLTQTPSLDLPSLVSDSVTRLPFSKQASQQIPTFIPLMCDPIVHVPILDVCSSGQGYLVSAGPAIATNIPPLHPNLVGPLVPDAESAVEKGARETLRLLMAGSSGQSGATSLMDVLPVVLNKDKPGVLVAGSRGLYAGTSDVSVIARSFAAVGLASLSMNGCSGVGGVVEHQDGGGGLERVSVDVEDSTLWCREEEKD